MYKQLKHYSADSSHYNQEAGQYDAFNEENSKLINTTIENILAENNVKTVVDLTCGTGSQVFWLTNRGYQVVGLDINETMLNIAKEKAWKQHLDIKLLQGDMRESQIGKFDAAITIFNAIGHLTKKDFEVAIRNISSNLNSNGLYIFDIFNLDYLLYKDNITKLTIDELRKNGDITFREIQYSVITPEGVLASYDIYYKQKGSAEPMISNAFQTLQVYNAKQLTSIMRKNGFQIVRFCNVDGSEFDQQKSERILTIARKL